MMINANMNIGSFKSQPIVQQDLKRLKLRSTPFCMSVLFYILAVIYLILFSYYGFSMLAVREVSKDYDAECENKTSCIVQINVTETLRKPVGLYYRLTNFYQLHRTIANSYSTRQLRGQIADEDELERCQPKTYINNTVHDANLFVPAGLLPAAVFNDTFSVLGYDGFDDSDITLNVDKNDLYLGSNPVYENSSRWLRDSGLFPSGITDKHFIAWMRQSAFGPFRKLYSKSDSDLPKGVYEVVIQNNYPTSLFKGNKSLIISEIRMFGTMKAGPAIVFGVMAFFFFFASAVQGFIGWRRKKPSSKFYPDNLKTMFVNTF
jgi:hypothetical protein